MTEKCVVSSLSGTGATPGATSSDLRAAFMSMPAASSAAYSLLVSQSTGTG